MIFFSFGNRAFNKEYVESNIYMVVAQKDRYADPIDFLNKAVSFIDEKVYPGEDFKADYKGMYLTDGEYRDIVEHWILSMDKSVEIKMDDILNIRRIKCDSSDPYRDEYVLETKDEYIMFLWSTTA